MLEHSKGEKMIKYSFQTFAARTSQCPITRSSQQHVYDVIGKLASDGPVFNKLLIWKSGQPGLSHCVLRAKN